MATISRARFTTVPRATFTTSVYLRKSIVDAGKDALKTADRAVSDKIVDGIDVGGMSEISSSLVCDTCIQRKLIFHLVDAKNKAKDAAAPIIGQAKGKASELSGEAQGKAAELKGEAKGNAASAQGTAEEKIGELKGKAKEKVNEL